MGLFDLALDSLRRMFPSRPVGGSLFYPLIPPDVFGKVNYLNEFCEIPELNAVINKRAKEFARGNYNVVDDKGIVQDDHWLQILIKNPNWFQAQKEFLRQSKLFHDIFGNEYTYNLTPVGLSKPARTKALFTLPPQLVEAKYPVTTAFFLTATDPGVTYVLKTDNGETPIDTASLLHQNDNKVDVTKVNDKSVLKGQSKMDGLKPALKNIRMAYESRGIILKYRGALGILSNNTNDVAGSVAVDPTEIENIQNQYRQYGGLDHQQQLIITSANLKWQQMSVNPDKLGLFQETEADFNKIMDSYDTPSELFVRATGSTYENQKQARKGFIQDTIWPEAIEWCGALNRKYLQEEKVKLVVDYSHLSIFQEDAKMRADALTGMVNALSKALVDGAITIEEYKIELQKFNIGTAKV